MRDLAESSCIPSLQAPANRRRHRSGLFTPEISTQSPGTSANGGAHLSLPRGFEAKPGRLMLLPSHRRTLAGALFGIEPPMRMKSTASGPGNCPANCRQEPIDSPTRHTICVWLHSPLRSARLPVLRATGRRMRAHVRLVVPEGVDGEDLSRIAEGVTLCRDPHQYALQRYGTGRTGGGRPRPRQRAWFKVQVTSGDALAKNFPLVHAVGAGSARAPRLIDMTEARPAIPKSRSSARVFVSDTGGLDIKPDTGMLNMKKDMGGAATALALAHMIMARRLKVRLRVIIPAVENSISGYQPSARATSTFRARAFQSKIGNTDAEGRLILADALALADEDKPALDRRHVADLTGARASRSAPEVAPFYHRSTMH